MTTNLILAVMACRPDLVAYADTSAWAQRRLEALDTALEEAYKAGLRTALEATAGYPPQCFYDDAAIEGLLRRAETDGLVRRQSTTQVELTTKGAQFIGAPIGCGTLGRLSDQADPPDGPNGQPEDIIEGLDR